LFEDEQVKEPIVTEIPADLVKEAEEARAKMIEQIAELDDDLIVKYLENEPISEEDLKTALRRAVIASKATAVFCGSSLKNKGVQPLIDAVVDYLPSPLEFRL
jgi:elongation factor G